MAKVLLFQCENEREIRQILTPMKIQAVSVPKTKFHMTLKELEREDDEEGYFEGAYPEGSMIVMCDFTEKQLDRLLMDFRNRNVKIDYKMVMTAGEDDVRDGAAGQKAFLASFLVAENFGL